MHDMFKHSFLTVDLCFNIECVLLPLRNSNAFLNRAVSNYSWEGGVTFDEFLYDFLRHCHLNSVLFRIKTWFKTCLEDEIVVFHVRFSGWKDITFHAEVTICYILS